MFGSTVLEVTIGLVFIFLLYSLLATTINEILATILGLRAYQLKKAIQRMLDDEQKNGTKLSDEFYNSPLIKYLGEKTGGVLTKMRSKDKPSYITQQNFSDALADLLTKKGLNKENWKDITWQGINQMENIEKALQAGNTLIPDGDTKGYLGSLLNEAGNDIDKFKTLLEKWFNDTMDRASGWYKKRVQMFLFIIGFFLAVLFNVDSISIVRVLSKDDNIRKKMAELASEYNSKPKPKVTADKNPKDTNAKAAVPGVQEGNINNDSTLKDLQKKLSEIDTAYSKVSEVNKVMGLGWKKNFLNLESNHQDYSAIIGWLLTALAISLGSPFWFDLLNKIINLRGSGPKPGEKDSKNVKEAKTP